MKSMLNSLDEKYAQNSIWQFVKFNLTGFTISFVQLLLANVLPSLFDSYTVKVPGFINSIFGTDYISSIDSKYVIDGVLTWGYLLPFFLSNMLANIYGYFVNMKFTFKGKGSKNSMTIYCIVLIILIIVSTWLQALVCSVINKTPFSSFSRTIAAMLAGSFQVAVLFPLEKYILFKEK